MNYSACFIFNLMECGIGACLGATIPLSCSAADGFRNIQRLCQLTPSNSSQDHPSCNTSFLPCTTNAVKSFTQYLPGDRNS